MKIKFNKNILGQSAVEFILIVPVLFLIFFGIIQLFYLAFASFAVQRAAYSIAQQAAASVSPSSFDPRLQIVEALLPLEQINSSTLINTLSTQCTINSDGKNVHVNITYPMPLWVPLVRNIVGQNLNNQLTPATVIPQSLTNALQTAGLSIPNLNPNQTPTKVIWFNFEAQASDENSIGADKTQP